MKTEEKNVLLAEDCPCTLLSCTAHGNCVECVSIHRQHKEHVPECIADILREDLKVIAAKIECGIIDNRPAIKKDRKKKAKCEVCKK